MGEVKKQCGDCYFWKVQSSDGEIGYCRRNPPRVADTLVQAVLSSGDYDGVAKWELARAGTCFPATYFEDGCGEWEPGEGLNSPIEMRDIFPANGLSVRSRKAVRKNNCTTYSDVLRVGRLRFMSTRHVGIATINELDSVMSKTPFHSQWMGS